MSSRLTDHLLRSPRPGPPPKGPASEPDMRPPGHDDPFDGPADPDLPVEVEEARPRGPNELPFYPALHCSALVDVAEHAPRPHAEEGAYCEADDGEAGGRGPAIAV
jgi:hypothetical protein